MQILKTKRSTQIDMLHGTLLDKILLFALPLAASSLLQQLFNAADIAVVGRFAGSQAQAAVGSTSFVINLTVNLFVGLSLGANAVIAGHIGRNDEKKIQESVHTVIMTALFCGFFLLFFGQLIAGWFLRLIQTPADVLPQAILYLKIYFLGMPFIMLYNFGAAILRSKGDTKRPMYSLLLSGAINILLNLLMVIRFQWGAAGVGIATVLSNVVSCVLVLYFLMREEEPLRLHWNRLSIQKDILAGCIRIGVPAGIQGMMFSLSNLCIQSSVNSFGADAIAGNTIALHFEWMSVFLINAFSQAAVTFTSQNHSVRQYGRCKKIFRLCLLCSIVMSGLMNGIFITGQDLFIHMFTASEAVAAFAALRVQRVLRFHCLTSSYEIGAAALRGIGFSMLPASITIVGTCLLRVAWVYTVFRACGSYEVLLYVYLISWLVTGTAVLGSYICVWRRVEGSHAA